ncbi:MAG: hypothetical protein ABIM44_09060 [candidate division WOR-3 bacterium]
MWLRLASSEDKAKLLEIASKLRNMGAKVELRELVEWEEDEQFVLKGKISELKKLPSAEKWIYEIEKWERRVKIIKEILKDQEIKYEDFLERFLKSEDPESYESAKKFLNGDLNIEEFVSSAEDAIKIKILLDELNFFLLRNGFEIGEFIKGSIPEDPEIMISLAEPTEGSTKLLTIDFFPVWELNVDVLSLLGEEVDNKELGSLLSVISNILLNVENIEDLDKLRELSSGVIDGSNEEILISCEEIFDLIVKSLEKSGIVRVSGKKIKLRKRQW